METQKLSEKIKEMSEKLEKLNNELSTTLKVLKDEKRDK